MKRSKAFQNPRTITTLIMCISVPPLMIMVRGENTDQDTSGSRFRTTVILRIKTKKEGEGGGR